METLQLTNNPDLLSVDGLAGLTTVQYVLISNNPRLCYVLEQLSDRAYWTVSGCGLSQRGVVCVEWVWSVPEGCGLCKMGVVCVEWVSV